jgi:L-lysine 2,3-aminomutase
VAPDEARSGAAQIIATEAGAGSGRGREVPWPTGSWRLLLREAVRDVAELLRELELEATGCGIDPDRASEFPLRVPRGFVAKMRAGDPGDPLLLQVLPRLAERVPVSGFLTDPLAERHAAPVPGVLHKYRGRVLLVATGACAVHCRYCFRRHYPYADASVSRDLDAALQYLRRDASIREVILSGGDPLTLSDEALGALLRELDGVPHLERLRLHTRVPVVLPERVDDGLIATLDRSRLRKVVVLHANHARELDATLGAALAPLRERGVTLLNQSVLLAGVNDDADVLCDLSEGLFGLGVLPYYLHLLDPVAGAAHFTVPVDRARVLAENLRERLPGYLVPRLVVEVPGLASKLPADLRHGDR